MKLSRKQARDLSFAISAHKTAFEELNNGNLEDYNVWSQMRDNKLKTLFGLTYNQLHDFGHEQAAA